MEDLPHPLVIERFVEFVHTDAAGIMHFTSYFTLVEAAEAELFRRIGFPLLWKADGREFGFPRVDCQCQYRRPFGFDDRIRIELSLASVDSRHIHYTFVFRDENNQQCAVGSMVTACAVKEIEGRMSGADIPGELQSTLIEWKNHHS